MAVTVQDVKDAFSEFSCVSTTKIERFLTQASGQISSDAWGESKADAGLLYLTAHFLKLDADGDSSPAGPLSSKRVGDISAGFAIGDVISKEWLSSTVYGRVYAQLRSLVFAARCLT